MCLLMACAERAPAVRAPLDCDQMSSLLLIFQKVSEKRRKEALGTLR